MSEAGNDLSQSMKVNALKGALIEAFPHGFPSFAAMHQRANVPLSVSSQSSRSDKKLGIRLSSVLRESSRTVGFLGFLENDLEIFKSDKVIKVLVFIVDLLQN